MEKTEIMEIILQRRSIREFESKPVPGEMIASILEAGRWAPSGLNNQPWRFVVADDEQILFKLAYMTKYSSILLQAPTAIAIFLDKKAGYSRDKDILAIGACIENMLLQIHALGLGACWLGEILNKAKEVEGLLKTPESYELLAVIALGFPKESDNREVNRERKDLKELIFGEWPLG
ncbi:MAG: nitroreductase family protein [bacterium]